MISIDKKLMKAALRLSRNYDDEIRYLPDSSELVIMDGFHVTDRTVPLDVPAQDVPGAIDRLVSDDYLRITTRYFGGFHFSITPRSLHRFAFLIDGFKAKFFAGFGCGFLTGIAANFAYDQLRTAIFELLRSLSAL